MSGSTPHDESADDSTAAGKPTRLGTAALAVGLMCSIALGCSGFFLMQDMGQLDRGMPNIFFHFATDYEPSHLVLVLLGSIGVFLLCARPERLDALDLPRFWKLEALGPRGIRILALCTFALCLGGWFSVYHQYPLSMDEFGAVFQSQLFSSGHINAVLPEPWVRLVPWVTPIFVDYNEVTHTWMSSYLPTYAAMRGLLDVVGASALLNPALAGGSVVLIARIARRLWPDDAIAGPAAAILLAGSPQMLAMSMGTYSMPAHLLLNLWWLELYLRGTSRSMALLPWVGFVALGLHQVVPHALFAAPFLLRLVLDRRWKPALYCAVVYLVAGVVWIAWRKLLLSPTAVLSMHQIIGLPDFIQALIQGSSLGLLWSWQSIAVGVFFFVGLFAIRGHVVAKDLALGVALTLGFHVFVRFQQGHGWGYRYVYGVLGNLVLLAVLGCVQLSRSIGVARIEKVLAISTVVLLFVQLPLRLRQIDQVIAPFAAVRTAIAQQHADVVIVPTGAAWYAQDLLRNDPLLRNKPIVVAARSLPPAAQRLIGRQGIVHLLMPEEMGAHGMVLTRSKQ